MVQETEVMRMVSQEELNSVDSRYFNIITVDDYDVTIQSRNTGHYRYLYSTDVPGDVAVSLSTSTNTAIPITGTGKKNPQTATFYTENRKNVLYCNIDRTPWLNVREGL